MKLSQIIKELSLVEITPYEEDVVPSGVYAGDFLSRAMSHVKDGNLWITIMSNTNVIAVASLSGASLIILAEGVELMQEAKEAAKKEGIGVFSSPLSVYDLCNELGKLL